MAASASTPDKTPTVTVAAVPTDKITRLEIQWNDDGTIGVQGTFINSAGVVITKGINNGNNPEYADKMSSVLGVGMQHAISNALLLSSQLDDTRARLNQVDTLIQTQQDNIANLEKQLGQYQALLAAATQVTPVTTTTTKAKANKGV